MPSIFEPSDRLALKRNKNRTHQPADAARPPKRFKPSDVMTLLSAAELVAIAPRPRKNHWGELIQSNQTGMIYGPRGKGKTWVAVGLAISMSTGIKFLGHEPRNVRRVVYLDGEMDILTLQARCYVRRIPRANNP